MGIKVRFDGLDVMAMVNHLNHVALGRRVINIYEGDTNDSFLFKLDHNVSSAATAAVPTTTETTTTGGGDDDTKEKILLYMESGIRFHTTTQMTNNSNNKSGAAIGQLAPFVFQLRKQLRGLRLESVTQLGQGDRVVHFVFGMGEQRRALLLELYAKGNIVLCDANYTILTLLRSHQYTAGNNDSKNNTGGVQVQIGHVYPVTYAARNVQVSADTTTTSAKEEDSNTKKNDSENDDTTKEDSLAVTASSSAQEWDAWAQEQVQQAAALAAEKAAQEAAAESNNNNTTKKGGGGGNKKKSKKDKQAGTLTLKTLLLKPSSGISHFGPNFLEHCLLLTPEFSGNTNNSLTPHTALSLETDNNNLPSVADWESFLQIFRQESAKLDDSDPTAADRAKMLRAAPPRGFILYSDKESSGNDGKESKNGQENKNSFANKVLEEFQPYLLLKQHEGRKVLEFDTFNEAVDTFFGHLEAQKRLLRAEAAEQAAKDKLEKVKHDQQLRIQGLEQELDKLQQQAQVVELNADSVEKALQVINSALDSGMDWEQLLQLIEVEQNENHNPIALLIYQLELEHDAMILELPTAEYVMGVDDGDEQVEEEEAAPQGDEDDNQKGKKKKKGKHKKGGKNGEAAGNQAPKKKVKKHHVLVAVSLHETAHGNASELFAKYRAMKEKTQRTVEASTKALKAAEDTAQRQLADAQQRTQQATNTSIGQVIKPPWFTKFHWFITSDNYLVLGGKDAHQNEALVKKFLRPGDAYLHADVHGAASCILRAKRIRVPAKNASGKHAKKGATTTKTLPLSDQALREAGNFTICRSSAWTSKMVTSAWWVESHQVSKTAPTGEYLTVGSFMIRGKKNFLPPTQLEMGLGVVFRLAAPEGVLDPATYERHKNERRDFALMELLQQHEDGEFESDAEEDVLEKEPYSNEEKPANPEPQVESKDAIEEAKITNESAVVDTPKEDNTESTAMASSGTPGGADESVPDTADTTSHATPSTGKAKKKGLSVKERKLIKKYGSLEEAEKVLAEREKEQEEKEKEKQALALEAPDDDEEEEDQDQYDANTNGGSMKRGKRGKNKKKKKYADQDDEDRELAMLALQGGEKIKKSNKDKRTVAPTTEEQKQAAAETAALLVKDAAEFAEKLPEDIRSVLAQVVSVKTDGEKEAVVKWDKFDADVLGQLITFEGPHEAKLAAAKRLLFLKSTTRIDNFSASLSGILRTIRKYGYQDMEIEIDERASGKTDGPKRKTKEEKEAEQAEWKETLAKEGLAGEDLGGGDDDDGDIDDTAENNKLTGKPHPEDSLLYALPICAPYQTLSQYTYRVKLTPGNMKRGKAAKQCLEMFVKGDGKSPAAPSNDLCRDLIKKVADNDWIQCICADVKISAAGASKVAKKQKANTKAKAKKKK